MPGGEPLPPRPISSVPVLGTAKRGLRPVPGSGTWTSPYIAALANAGAGSAVFAGKILRDTTVTVAAIFARLLNTALARLLQGAWRGIVTAYGQRAALFTQLLKAPSALFALIRAALATRAGKALAAAVASIICLSITWSAGSGGGQGGSNARQGVVTNFGTDISLLFGSIRFQTQVQLYAGKPTQPISLPRLASLTGDRQQQQAAPGGGGGGAAAASGNGSGSSGSARLIFQEAAGADGAGRAGGEREDEEVTVICSQDFKTHIMSFLAQQQQTAGAAAPGADGAVPAAPLLIINSPAAGSPVSRIASQQAAGVAASRDGPLLLPLPAESPAVTPSRHASAVAVAAAGGSRMLQHQTSMDGGPDVISNLSTATVGGIAQMLRHQQATSSPIRMRTSDARGSSQASSPLGNESSLLSASLTEGTPSGKGAAGRGAGSRFVSRSSRDPAAAGGGLALPRNGSSGSLIGRAAVSPAAAAAAAGAPLMAVAAAAAAATPPAAAGGAGDAAAGAPHSAAARRLFARTSSTGNSGSADAADSVEGPGAGTIEASALSRSLAAAQQQRQRRNSSSSTTTFARPSSSSSLHAGEAAGGAAGAAGSRSSGIRAAPAAAAFGGLAASPTPAASLAAGSAALRVPGSAGAGGAQAPLAGGKTYRPLTAAAVQPVVGSPRTSALSGLSRQP